MNIQRTPRKFDEKKYDGKFEVYEQSMFYEAFAKDLRSAKALVLIHSPFIKQRKLDILRKSFEECLRRKVRVCAFIQEPWSQADTERKLEIESACRTLSEMGVHVTLRKKIHQKLAVIDEDILWEGSLNILSHYDTVERMTRWQSADMVLEAVSTNGLYGCNQCLHRGGFAPDPDARSFVARQRLLIGQAIAKRRKALHLTQRLLSEEIGVDQKTICSIEAGKRNVQLDALLHILLRLNMGLRAVDWFLLPTVDEQIGASEAIPSEVQASA